MTIAKQIDIRSNIKKYFDMAYGGDTIIVPRKENKNVVIISEEEYNRLSRQNRLSAYADMQIEKMADAKSIHQTNTTVKEDNLEKLRVIGQFKDNWNGNGAEAFPQALISRVRDIINDLLIQPEVFPTALGTIQLEYDNSRRDHMEIEIGMGDDAELFISSYNGEERFETFEASGRSINEKVREFYG